MGGVIGFVVFVIVGLGVVGVKKVYDGYWEFWFWFCGCVLSEGLCSLFL